MKFRYVGEAPNGSFEMYGATWTPGEVSDVSNELFCTKLAGNPFFEAVEDAPEAPRRKKKVTADDQNVD